MQKCYHSSWVLGTWTTPIIHEVMIGYLQEKKITFGTYLKINYIDRKRHSTWNASGLGGQINNVLAHIQQ